MVAAPDGRSCTVGRAVGIRMGEDGRTLWVGLPNDRQIAAVDTGSLTVRARYNVGSDVCPGDVAQTGRFVAFGFSCFIYSDEFLPPTPTGVGVLDTQTGAVTAAEIGAGYQPIVATSPGLPGRVFATDYLVHEVWLSLLDVSSGSPQWITGRRLGMVNPVDVAVSPDGSRVPVRRGHRDDRDRHPAGHVRIGTDRRAARRVLSDQRADHLHRHLLGQHLATAGDGHHQRIAITLMGKP